MRNLIPTKIDLLQLVHAATERVVAASVAAAVIINVNELVRQDTHHLHPLVSVVLIGVAILEHSATLFVNDSAKHLNTIVIAIANSIIGYAAALIKAIIAFRDATALID